MAPSGEPVAELILQDIETTLAAIAEGASYYTDVVQVRRGDGLVQDSDPFPAIILSVGRAQHSPPGQEVTGLIATHGQYNARLVLPCNENPQREIMRFIRDVHTALYVDKGRGGYAVETLVTASDPFIPLDTDDLIIADVSITVHFRVDQDDLNTAG